MYTGKHTIFNSNQHKVVSYGNGCAYVIERKRDGASVCLQGEDATLFSAEFGSYPTGDGLCAEYHSVMEV